MIWENTLSTVSSKVHLENRTSSPVLCNLHLPNHPLVDDKWALSRFSAQMLLRGGGSSLLETYHVSSQSELLNFYNLHLKGDSSPDNLWVLKDANTNGAGGVWVLSPSNFSRFYGPSFPSPQASPPPSLPSSSPLNFANARYVIQRYASPPQLYLGRKFHVRVYALLLPNGLSRVHRRCFLHVANKAFPVGGAATTTRSTSPTAAPTPGAGPPSRGRSARTC